MAMLAEPRRKKNYNLNPKGKPLFEDNDRFGTKMLSKMGWSKGKGLGKNENGQEDFIRVRYKNDANGFGFEDRDDQWTEHEKQFNGLLENLNSANNSATNSGDDDEDSRPSFGLGLKSDSSTKKKLKDKFSGQSLEEKSKNSKARVHYKKFTKGKDMAQYSEKDLANIFGKKATAEDTNIYNQFQAYNATDEKEEPKENGTKENPKTFEQNMINSGLSVSDYFKMKMAALKSKTSNSLESNAEDKLEEDKVKDKNSVENKGPENCDEETKRKKKKNKQQDSVRSEENNVELENLTDQSIKKSQNSPEALIHEIITLPVKEEIVEAHSTKKKKSKKTKSRDADDEPHPTDSIVEVEIDQSVHDDKESKNDTKKKTKKRKHEECSSNEAEDSNKTGKKKTKKLRDDTSTIECTEFISNNLKQEENLNLPQDEQAQNETVNSKPKKKKKNIKSTPESTILNDVSLQQLNFNPSKEDPLEDTYDISEFCAEKFRNVELGRFNGSNIMEISGYGFSENLKLNIIQSKNDANRILKLWTGTVNKYTNGVPKRKMYSNYMYKAKKSMSKKTGIPKLKTKSLKRKNVFQCL